MKVDLGSFISVQDREQLIEQILLTQDAKVVVDASQLAQSATQDEFDQLTLSIKFFAERLRRYGRKIPLIELVAPCDPYALDLTRVDELRRVSGLEITVV